MKNLFSMLFIACLFFVSSEVSAQIKAPAPSPNSKLMQTVGLTDVTVEYARPGKKGRDIFGGLVQYDEMWRTGANANTKITFSEDVKINGAELKKGTYAIFTKPGESMWKVVFYTKTDNWGVPREWDDTAVAAKVKVAPMKTSHTVETFTIDVSNLRNDGADITIAWDDTAIKLDLEVPTDAAVVANIEKVMAGPSANDYYTAARYYKDSGKDLAQALAWIDKSLEMNPDRFWVVRQKALIQAKMGSYDDAIATAKKSMEMAEAAGNMDYVRNNEKSIAKWMKKKSKG